MAKPYTHQLVVLISIDGHIITHFNTNRTDFPALATHDRDRIFSLIFAGDLASLPEMDLPSGIIIKGAMYKEVDAWRISHRTIDKPRPRKRRLKTAVILPFRRREGRA